MYGNGDFEERLHGTWLTVLIESGHRQVAALVVDADLVKIQRRFDPEGFYVDLPPSSLPLV